MPTPFMPDEEFDAQFRRGLEQYPEQPESPAAWHRMALLLDAGLRQQALRRRLLRLLGAETLLLLLVLGSILHFVAGSIRPHSAGSALAGAARPATRPTEFLTAPAARPLPAARSGFSPTPGGPVALTAPALAGRPPRSTASSLVATSEASRRPGYQPLALPLAAPARHRRPHPAAVASPWAGTLAASASAARLAGAAPTARSRRSRQLQPTTASPAGEAAAARNPAVPLARGPRPARPAAVASYFGPLAAGAIDSLHPRPLTSGLAFHQPDSLARVAQLAAAYPAADSLARPRLAWGAYRLRLGLVGSPELSTVRDLRLTGTGGGVGGQLDYQPFPRWHLSAAYLVTLKRYAARPEDYHLPADVVLPPGWVISNVDAVCRIVDIPLNLRYDLWQRPRHQWFASAGLSSLLMQSERYTYDYYPDPVSGAPIPAYDLEMRNGSQHVLKVLNLSAGYERMLGQRWTVQAEPFVKVPLGGVGFGTVRLSSAGVFFSLRYGLLPVKRAGSQVSN